MCCLIAIVASLVALCKVQLIAPTQASLFPPLFGWRLLLGSFWVCGGWFVHTWLGFETRAVAAEKPANSKLVSHLQLLQEALQAE